MMSAMSAMLAVSMAANGWGTGHSVIRQTAINWLPEWQQEMLGDAATSLATKYTSLQDAHAGGKRPDLDPYCVVPDCKLSLHDVCPIPDGTTAMAWYLQRTAEEIQAGNTDEAAKYLGVLCHWMEDPSSASMHCVRGIIDEYRLRELIPPPADKRKYHYLYAYSGISDIGKYDLPDEDYEPRLLGRTFNEAAQHIYQAQRHNAKMACASVVGIALSEMHGDGSEAAKLRSHLVFESSKTTADVLFTALSLAAGRYDEADIAELDAVPLTDLISDYQGGAAGAPYKWVPFLEDASFDAGRNVLPVQLPGDDGVVEYERGVGMGAPFTLVYMLAPGGVFSSFTSTVGLHPAAGEGGSVKFIVRANGVVVAEAGPIAAGAPGQVITAAIPADPIIKLELIAERGEGSVEIDNLAVWAEPTLHAATNLDPQG